jgi:uncharacterized glyoxalase superfamily protein PhnB
MQANRSIPDVTIIPELQYADLGDAVRWLCDVLGFRERLRIHGHRVQLTFGGGAMVAVQGDGGGGRDHAVMVRVDDVDAHCARVRQAGGHIVREPETYPFGERQYSLVDPGGHAWTFTQTVADVDPAEWGGELVAGA